MLRWIVLAAVLAHCHTNDLSALRAHQPDASGEECTPFGIQDPFNYRSDESLGGPVVVQRGCPVLEQGKQLGIASCTTVQFIASELESGGFEHAITARLFPDLSTAESLIGSTHLRFRVYAPVVAQLAQTIDVSLLLTLNDGTSRQLEPVTVIRSNEWQTVRFMWSNQAWRQYRQKCLHKKVAIVFDDSREEGVCTSQSTCAQLGVSKTTDIYGCLTGQVCCTQVEPEEFENASPVSIVAKINHFSLLFSSNDRTGRIVDELYIGSADKCVDPCGGSCDRSKGMACDKSGVCSCINSPPFLLGPDNKCYDMREGDWPCKLCPASNSAANYLDEYKILDERTTCSNMQIAPLRYSYGCDCLPGYYRKQNLLKKLLFECVPFECTPSCDTTRAHCARLGSQSICKCNLGYQNFDGSADGSGCESMIDCLCGRGQVCLPNTKECVCNSEAGWIEDTSDSLHPCRKVCEPACADERELCETKETPTGFVLTVCVCKQGYRAVVDRFEDKRIYCAKTCRVPCASPETTCVDGECVCNALEKYFPNPSTGACELHESRAADDAAAEKEKLLMKEEEEKEKACSGVVCDYPLTEQCNPETMQCECRPTHPLRNAEGLCASPCDDCGDNTECRFFGCVCKSGWVRETEGAKGCLKKEQREIVEPVVPSDSNENLFGFTNMQLVLLYSGIAVLVCCCIILCFIIGGVAIVKYTGPQDMLKYENPLRKQMREDAARVQRDNCIQMVLDSDKQAF